MPYILDAYNVLHAAHEVSALAAADVAELCRLLEGCPALTGRVVVVCDGAPPRGGEVQSQVGRVELLYAGGGKEADDLIERLIEQDTGPRELTVVSDDHRIQRAAGRRGARVQGSGDFLRWVAGQKGRRPRPREKPEVETDVDGWMKKFGYGKKQP